MSPVTRSPGRGPSPPLRVSQAARALGLGVQTLHYYERRGLLPPPPRTAKGYRLYPPELLERVRFVRKAQSLGFSLAEIKEILDLADHGVSPCEHVRSSLTAKLQEVDRRLAELRAFREDLAALVARVGELAAREAEICAILEAQRPADESGPAPAALPRR